MRILRRITVAINLGIGVASAILGASAPAAAQCRLIQLAEIRVGREQNKPVMIGEINGQKIRMLIDIGSLDTYVAEASAKRLGLPVRVYTDARSYGVGGNAEVKSALVKELKFGGFTRKEQRLTVLDSRVDRQPEDIDFILGFDFFSKVDVEFDLANDVFRLWQPDDCRPEQMIYWRKDYSSAELEPPNRDSPLMRTVVLINGQRVEATWDTGESISHISNRAARRSGVTMGTEGAPSMPRINEFGKSTPTSSSIGTFDTLMIGEETIRNAKIRISDLFGGDQAGQTTSPGFGFFEGLPDMLIGDDFFQSHRVLLMPRERKVLFTYNGSQVFQLLRPDEAFPAPDGDRR
jgi:predicted aspartyl protease